MNPLRTDSRLPSPSARRQATAALALALLCGTHAAYADEATNPAPVANPPSAPNPTTNPPQAPAPASSATATTTAAPGPVIAMPPEVEAPPTTPGVSLPPPKSYRLTDLVNTVGPGLGRRLGIGGYGEAQLVVRDSDTRADLRRFVLFAGYEFNDWIRLYSELEVEHATEVEVEQAYVEIAPWKFLGMRAGLMVLPLGLLNLYHEPPTFHGVDRPLVDQLIIPSTWRELGVGFYGAIVEGLHYQVYVMNGLDGSKFDADTGLVNGRGQGANVRADDGAVTGRINFNRVLGLDIGVGGYYGGSSAGNAALAGTHVGLVEADLRFQRWGLSLKAEYAHVFVDGADKITALLRTTDPNAEVVGASMYGYYGELAYDVLYASHKTSHELIPFVRYEELNTQATVPSVAGAEVHVPRRFFSVGLTYKPHPQLALKVDYRRGLSGTESPPAGATGEAAEIDASANRFSAGVGFMF